MKICLFGATGLLGSEFKKLFIEQEFGFIAPKSSELSLLKHDKVLAYLKAEKPTLIINCAAYTAVDKAEKNEEICMKLNGDAVTNLVKAGIPIINFSTEYVFNAPVGLEIPEDYQRDPQSVYGKSKAQAEEALEASDIGWWNIRTSWLWSDGTNNFVSTIKRLSTKYDELTIIDDQIGRPTYAPELANFVVEHFVRPVSNLESSSGDRSLVLETGHYHLQNTGSPVSWAGFAQYFLNQEAWHGKIKKISTEEYGATAVRPKNSVLKNTKLDEEMSDWKERFTQLQ
jgi:dTDP-4-dehydrorhamnose reductase